jgi:hypothetical protein
MGLVMPQPRGLFGDERLKNTIKDNKTNTIRINNQEIEETYFALN